MAPMERHVWNCERDEFERRITVGLVDTSELGDRAAPFFFEIGELAAFAAELNGTSSTGPRDAKRLIMGKPIEPAVAADQAGATRSGRVPEKEIADWLASAVEQKIRIGPARDELAERFPAHVQPGRKDLRDRHKHLWEERWGAGSYPKPGAPKQKES